MPVKFGGKTFARFKDAVRYVQKKKGFSKERASAYVAGIEKRQRVRFRNSR